MATAIKKKPTAGVNSLTAPTREGGGSVNYTSTWKTNNADLKDTNNHRATGYRWWWVINLKSTSGSTAQWKTKTYTRSNMSLTSVSLSLNSIALSNGTTKRLSDLFPNTGWYVASISINVQYTNKKGNGPTKTATRGHGVARRPEVSELVQDEETGHVSCTVKADDGNDYNDRYDTQYTMLVRDTRLDEESQDTTTVSTSTESSFDVSFDVEDRFELTYEQYVMVRVTAQSRGYTGPSGNVTKEIYVGWPNQPHIKADEVTCPSRSQGGKVTLPIDLNVTETHPVTGCILQVLADVDYEKASDIPATEEDNWKDVGVQDDGECTALSVNMALVMPSTAGKRSWVRVKSWNLIEEGFYRYSDYFQLENLYAPAPTAEDDDCSILSCVGANDGLGAVVTIGFDDDGNTGTEVAWSDREDAWTSTDQPDTFQVTWEDDTPASSDWDKSCTVGIRGLDDGTTYYVKARRYLEDDDNDVTTYSPWCNVKTVTPSVAPSAVTLVAPASVPRGSSCPLTWTFSGGVQTAWAVMHDGRVVLEGTDSMGSCSIPSERMDSIVGAGRSTTLSVVVATSGGTATSDDVVVVVDDPPGIEVSDATVTAQPMALTANCTTDNADVAVTIRSHGVTESSLGQPDQAPGDVVWSEVVSPEWSQRTLDQTNLVSNLPAAWQNGAAEEYELEAQDGQEPETAWRLTDDGLLSRTSDAIPVDASSTYTASVSGGWSDGSTDRWAIGVFEVLTDGTMSPTTNYLTSDSETFQTAATSVGVYLVLQHEVYVTDEWVVSNAATISVGSDALVMLEKSASASEWEPHASDLPAYTATITAPSGLDLRDGGSYTVSATAIDRDTGLSSETATCDASVAWAHQAPVPSDEAITLTPSDVTDEDGIRTRMCVITLVAPTGAASGDLYDVWRRTPDRHYLIAEGVPLATTVTDSYAPYGTGDYGYRVVCRTVDGDTAWTDYDYTLPGRDVRIDFGEEYVELPYNVQLQDAYTKSFESREKLDGSYDGYWNDGTERKGTYSSDLIRIRETEKAAAVRRLAHHFGACFVRTPDGCAYTANVDVNSFGGARRDGALAVSIDATEIASSGEYQATIPDVDYVGG